MKLFWIAFGVIVVLVLSVTWVMTGQQGSSPKAERLACQQEVTTFDRWRVERAERQSAQSKLLAGNFTLEGSQSYSEHMPSRLKGVFDDQKIEAMLIEAIGISPIEGAEALEIRWRLFEDDKADPNKLNPAKAHFAGYLRVSFVDEGQEIYRIQIDYLEYDGADLPRRAACVIDSFLQD